MFPIKIEAQNIKFSINVSYTIINIYKIKPKFSIINKLVYESKSFFFFCSYTCLQLDVKISNYTSTLLDLKKLNCVKNINTYFSKSCNIKHKVNNSFYKNV